MTASILTSLARSVADRPESNICSTRAFAVRAPRSALRPAAAMCTALARLSVSVRFLSSNPFSVMRRIISAIVERSIPVIVTSLAYALVLFDRGESHELLLRKVAGPGLAQEEVASALHAAAQEILGPRQMGTAVRLRSGI